MVKSANIEYSSVLVMGHEMGMVIIVRVSELTHVTGKSFGSSESYEAVHKPGQTENVCNNS